MENKLTEQQIEKAAEAMWLVDGRTHTWNHASEASKVAYRKCVRAAAPYLQMPIAEPSEEEVRQMLQDYYHDPERFGPSFHADMRDALGDFIRRRNAALLPQPDPRREAIERALTTAQVGGSEARISKIADAVLAALEEVQK